MSDSGYKVETLSPEETERLFGQTQRAAHKDITNRNDRRAIRLAGGIQLQGVFEVTARDAESGAVEWQWSDKNLLTVLGLNFWMNARLYTALRLGLLPSTETPMAIRSSMSCDASQAVVSGNLTPTTVPATHTKTFSTTFGTPGSNRTLGTVFLGATNQTILANLGHSNLLAYSLLTPPKTQTTTQTVELVYKISATLVV